MSKLTHSLLVIALLSACNLPTMAQKSFKFERVNFIPKEMKEVVFPAQLTKIGPDDTYKFVGTQNTIDVYPAQMNLGKGNGVNVKDGTAKYTIEVFYTKKPEFKRAFDFQNARYTGDTNAGVCLRTEVKLGVGCKIKGEDGSTLVYFSLIDSSSVEKGFVGYDAAKNAVSITDKPSSAKWGSEETAGRFFNDHEGAIRGLAVKKAVEYAGNKLAKRVQLFLVGDKYSKLQYADIPQKLQTAYPSEAALAKEAGQLYGQWLQSIEDSKLNTELSALSEKFASLDVKGKSIDYNYFVYTNAAMLAAMAQNFDKAHEYGVLADKNDPNTWKPSLSNTIYGIYQMYMLRKLLAERTSPDVFVDLAGGVANVYKR